jgi:hypothetical protein
MLRQTGLSNKNLTDKLNKAADHYKSVSLVGGSNIWEEFDE